MADEPKPAAPRLLDNPLVRRAIDIAIAVALAWLASKGIRLPVEQQAAPPVVVVNATAPADHK